MILVPRRNESERILFLNKNILFLVKLDSDNQTHTDTTLLSKGNAPQNLDLIQLCEWICSFNPLNMKKVKEPQRKRIFKWNLAPEN